MARLSHPNVLPVFEADIFAGQVFVAMEFVEGETLSAWLRAKTRGWREILDAFLKAGDGLAAAHRAGIIHRDFKPDNVLVGADGRVRVTDFGLARTTAGASANAAAIEAPSDEASEPPVTRTGQILGTPAFMAPEQIRGEPPTPWADQFSFCVALYQGLYNERPFPGGNASELETSIRRGEVRAPSRGSQVPAWVRRALLRGLRARPEERFSSMADLLAELRKDPRKVRRRALAASLALAIAVALPLGSYHAFSGEKALCTGAEAEIAAVWNPHRAGEIRAAFLATKDALAPETAAVVERGVDGYASAWAAMHRDACEATRVHGHQSEELLDLRMRCLSRSRGELAALLDLFAHPDAQLVRKAASAVRQLTPLVNCRDEGLLRSSGRPADPALRPQEEKLRADLARANALFLTAQFPPAEGRAARARDEARERGLLAVEAEALILLGKSESYRRAPAVRATLESGFRAAVVAERDDLAVRALLGLAFAAGIGEAKVQEAFDFLRSAEVLLRRMGEAAELRSTLLYHRGILVEEQGQYLEALGYYEQAAAMRERALGPQHPSFGASLSALGLVSHNLKRYEASRRYYLRALAIFERTSGPNHPDVAIDLTNLGRVLAAMGDYDGALRSHERALRIRERAFGKEHTYVAISLRHIGEVLHARGDYARALSTYERSLSMFSRFSPGIPNAAGTRWNIAELLHEMGRDQDADKAIVETIVQFEKIRGPKHPDVAQSLALAARIRARLGRRDEALSDARRAIAIDEATGRARSPLAQDLSSLSEVLLAMGRAREAREHARRAVEILAKEIGPRHRYTATALAEQGAAELALGRPSEAATTLDRALSILDSEGGLLATRAEARFLLAQSLWPASSERPRALRLARQARDELGRIGRSAGKIAAWLSTRRQR
jgi:tetratricopeptide (TPR) repeat protein